MVNESAMMSDQWVINPSRLQRFKFGGVASEVNAVLVFAKPNVTDLQWITRIFDVFQPATYVLLFSNAFLLLIVLAVIDVHFYGNRNPITMLTSFQSIQKTLKPARSPLILTFNFLIIISIGLYQSLLLTRLFLNPTPEIMNTERFLQRLEDGTFSMVFSSNQVNMVQHIRNDPHPFFQRLRASVQKNPYHIQSNWSKLLSMLETGRFVTFAGEISVR